MNLGGGVSVGRVVGAAEMPAVSAGMTGRGEVECAISVNAP